MLQNAKRFVVLEKAFSVGIGGIVSSHCRAAMRGRPFKCHELIAGLGGRNITGTSLHEYLDTAVVDTSTDHLPGFGQGTADRNLSAKQTLAALVPQLKTSSARDRVND